MCVTSMGLDACHLHGSGCLSPPWIWMCVTSMNLELVPSWTVPRLCGCKLVGLSNLAQCKLDLMFIMLASTDKSQHV